MGVAFFSSFLNFWKSADGASISVILESKLMTDVTQETFAEGHAIATKSLKGERTFLALSMQFFHESLLVADNS